MHKIRCPRCGSINEGDSLFCAECGCGLKKGGAGKRKRPAGNAVFLAIGAVCAALVVLALVCAAFYVMGQEKKEEPLLGTDVTETQGQEIEAGQKEGGPGPYDAKAAAAEGTERAEAGETKTERAEAGEAKTERAEAGEPERTGIHTYRLVLKDCGWQEAAEDCRAMGGYLARIESYEEYAAIVHQIGREEGFYNAHFYLGGRREEGETDYYWVDGDGQKMGKPLNSADSWAGGAWMKGEPSYVDGEAQELYLNLFCYEKEMAWVLNDVPEDVSAYYPGKTGYICEFEE